MSAFLKGSYEFDGKLTLRKDTTFLRALTSDKKTIYYFKTPENTDQFYIGESTFDLLIYKRYKTVNAKGLNSYGENKRFIGQLILYLQDCPIIQKKLKTISYREIDLEKLILSYNQCVNPKANSKKVKSKISGQFGVLAGVVQTKLIFDGAQFPYLANAKWRMARTFSGGMFADLVLPRNQQKWVLGNELIFSSYSTTGQYRDIANANNYTDNTSNFSLAYLKLNNLLRYRHPIGSGYWFINAGISNGFAISLSENHLHRKSFLYGTTREEDSDAISGPRKYEFGLLGGTGFGWSRFRIEGRYEIGNGISDIIALSSSTKRISVMAAIRLNKK
jgi:hypothetical protein